MSCLLVVLSLKEVPEAPGEVREREWLDSVSRACQRHSPRVRKCPKMPYHTCKTLPQNTRKQAAAQSNFSGAILASKVALLTSTACFIYY